MKRGMMKSNITLEQYIEIVEKAKSAALYDLDSFDIFELHNPVNPVFSVLGVQLCCRDDEDAFWVIGYDYYKLFLRFNPDLMKYIREESITLLEDDEPLKESARDKLYWEVTKYIKVNNVMCRMYVADFSLDCELLGVDWHCQIDLPQRDMIPDYRHFKDNPKKYLKMSDAQCFLHDSAEQLRFPLNVELPYQPGDILYIDARPFYKPLYAVYCAETDGDREYFEWTLEEYGYYKRSYPCLIAKDEDGDGPYFIELTHHTPFLSFPYVPLDRISVVEQCNDLLLMKASGQLKKDPDLYRAWLAVLNDKKVDQYKNLEHIILDNS